MAKITRQTQKLFGTNALTAGDEIGVFGSLAAGTPDYGTDVEDMQSLSEWLDGWLGAVVGGNSPAIEDMNAFCYVVVYQLAYLLQTGVGEWDAGTTYYIGSVVNDTDGNLYASITDDNLNNALTDLDEWRSLSGNVVVDETSTGALDVPPGASLTRFDATSGNQEPTLPDATAYPGLRLILKKVDSGSNTVTIDGTSSQTMDGVSSYVLSEQFQFVEVMSNGTNWDIVSAG